MPSTASEHDLRQRLRYAGAGSDRRCQHGHRRYAPSARSIHLRLAMQRPSARGHVSAILRSRHGDAGEMSYDRTYSPQDGMLASDRLRWREKTTQREAVFNSMVYWSEEASTSRHPADIGKRLTQRKLNPQISIRPSKSVHREKRTANQEPAFDSIAYWSGEASPSPPAPGGPAVLKHKMYGGYKSPRTEEERLEQEEDDKAKRKWRAKMFARTPEEMERRSRTYRRLARWNRDAEGTEVKEWAPKAARSEDGESLISPTFIPVNERGLWETVTYKKRKGKRSQIDQ